MKIFLLTLFIAFGLMTNAQVGKSVLSQGEAVKVLKFYPNPAVSVINFEFQKSFDKGYTLQIYNFIGKKVSEVTSLSAKTAVPLTDFFRGIYIYQLRDKTGKIIESGKFQVVK